MIPMQNAMLRKAERRESAFLSMEHPHVYLRKSFVLFVPMHAGIQASKQGDAVRSQTV